MRFIGRLVRKIRRLPDVDAFHAAGDVGALLIAMNHTHRPTSAAANAAIVALWEKDRAGVRERLLAAVEAGNSAAALALGWLKDPEAEGPLVKLLRFTAPSARAGAIDALGSMGAISAQAGIVAELLRDAGESNRWTRVAAAIALGKIGSPSPAVLDALLVSSVCEYPLLREYSRDALRMLGRSDLAEQALATFVDAHDVEFRARLKTSLRMELQKKFGSGNPRQ